MTGNVMTRTLAMAREIVLTISNRAPTFVVVLHQPVMSPKHALDLAVIVQSIFTKQKTPHALVHQTVVTVMPLILVTTTVTALITICQPLPFAALQMVLAMLLKCAQAQVALAQTINSKLLVPLALE